MSRWRSRAAGRKDTGSLLIPELRFQDERGAEKAPPFAVYAAMKNNMGRASGHLQRDNPPIQSQMQSIMRRFPRGFSALASRGSLRLLR